MHSSLTVERDSASRACIHEVTRSATSAQSVEQMLEEATVALRTLAAQPIWRAVDFPIPDGKLWQAYELFVDEESGISLYAVPMYAGHAQPPHDHNTWAVIAGIDGVERNILYAKPMDGRDAPLVRAKEIDVGAGDALALRADELHSIEVTSGQPALHLHIYGRPLDRLGIRRAYDLDTGKPRTFEVLGPFPHPPTNSRKPK